MLKSKAQNEILQEGKKIEQMMGEKKQKKGGPGGRQAGSTSMVSDRRGGGASKGWEKEHPGMEGRAEGMDLGGTASEWIDYQVPLPDFWLWL